MPIPDAEHAIITQEKLCEYLLNPAHPVGGPKAAWFASVGYTLQNWEQLRDDVLRLVKSCEDFLAKPSPYGAKYETEVRLGVRVTVRQLCWRFGSSKRILRLA